MSMGMTYIDITGLYHLNKPGVTGVYRVEDQISRFVSKNRLQNTHICTWTSVAKGYFKVIYNNKIDNHHKRFMNHGIGNIKKICNFMLKSILFLLSLKYIANILKLFFRIVKMKRMCERIEKIRKNWRSIYNNRSNKTDNLIRFNSTDTLLIPTSAYISNVNYVNNMISTYKLSNCRIIIFIYDMLPYFDLACSQKYKAFSIAMEAIAKYKFEIITISQYSKNEILRYFDLQNQVASNITVISLPVTFPNYKYKPKLINQIKHKKYALYVSTLGERKNHIFLLNIWQQLFEEHGKNIPLLVFVGKDAESSEIINRRINEFPDELKNSIVLTGSITDRELYFYYKLSWITLFPSLFEGWGLPVSEAQYFGKVCICNTGSSLDEAADGYSDSISVANSQAWKNRISEYYFNEKLLTSKEKYLKDNIFKSNWDTYCKEIINLVNN